MHRELQWICADNRSTFTKTDPGLIDRHDSSGRRSSGGGIVVPNFKSVLVSVAFAFFGLGISAPAFAGPIVSVGGQLVVVPTPTSLDYAGTQFSGYLNSAPVIFPELVNTAIPVFSALPASDPRLVAEGLSPSMFVGLDFVPIDITQSGSYGAGPLTPGQILSGTVVDSFVVNFEPNDSTPFATAYGSVTFAGEVIGIEADASNLDLFRNKLFELPGVSLYGSTGTELTSPDSDGADWLTLSPDRHTITFNLNLVGATDDFRVFTTPVPEPSTVSLFALGLFGALLLARRRRESGSAL
jgi:hypothetical protein